MAPAGHRRGGLPGLRSDTSPRPVRRNRSLKGNVNDKQLGDVTLDLLITAVRDHLHSSPVNKGNPLGLPVKLAWGQRLFLDFFSKDE